MLNLCVLGKANQVISLVEGMKYNFFPDMFVKRLPCKSSGCRGLIQRSSINAEVSFAIDFMFVF